MGDRRTMVTDRVTPAWTRARARWSGKRWRGECAWDRDGAVTDGATARDVGVKKNAANAATVAKSDGAEAVKENVRWHAAKSTSALPIEFGTPEMYQAVAQSVREGLFDRWNDTYAHFHKENPKQAYYLSMEYLQGRALTNAIGNMGLTGEYSDAIRSLGVHARGRDERRTQRGSR